MFAGVHSTQPEVLTGDHLPCGNTAEAPVLMVLVTAVPFSFTNPISRLAAAWNGQHLSQV